MIPTVLLIGGAILLAVGLLQFLHLVRQARRANTHRAERFRSSGELLRQRVDAARSPRETRSTVPAWQGYRRFRVERKTLENTAGVCSLALVPCDGKPLATFVPGQYLTFRFSIPGQSKPVVRCYSLSDCHAERTTCYRVTIKKLAAPQDDRNIPPGVASTYVYHHIKEGDTLEVKAPAGNFVLDQPDDVPVVLISGGIGITPLLSMLNAIVTAGSKRKTWFYYGVRDGTEHIMREHLARLRREFSHLHMRICYSAPREADRKGIDYDFAGRITLDLIRREAPWRDAVFYVCGPSSLMTSMIQGLLASGVPKARVKSEAFGPASVGMNRPALGAAASSQGAIHINFTKSSRRIPWNPEACNLLDFAHENDVEIESGCRAGSCGTCSVTVKAGDVIYLQEPDVECELGTCLTCIAAPRTELTIEA